MKWDAFTPTLTVLFCLFSSSLFPLGHDGGKPFMHTNRLIHESSPYLLQHAHNPVDWYPWGPEALEAARKQNKPIFLSVGYATCHWCHVMEREAFNVEAVAKIMNANFICIKVDREERPDLDAFYMRALISMQGSGGWPMNLFLTPELKPFYGGTYFPPQPKWGRPSFSQVLLGVANAWKTQRQKLIDESLSLHKTVLSSLKPFGNTAGHPREKTALLASYSSQYDQEWGGFGQAPKFPQCPQLNQLEQLGPQGKDILRGTLAAMVTGGIHDQVGGGFHRYSTDREWLVPHFEKMLYDNAQLLPLLAHEAAGDPNGPWRQAAENLVEWLEREMVIPGRGYASALDADTQGKEGQTYVWTFPAFKWILGEKDGLLAASYYGVTTGGNLEGKSILTSHTPLAVWAKTHSLSQKEAIQKEMKWQKSLLKARMKRPQPTRDDKIVTEWNALLGIGLLEAGEILGKDTWIQRSDQLFNHLRSTVEGKTHRLVHTWRGGVNGPPGMLGAYPAMALFAERLWQHSGNPNHYQAFLDFGHAMDNLFWDSETGSFRMSRAKNIPPIFEAQDGPSPSGIGLAAEVLWRLEVHAKEKMASAHLDNLMSTNGTLLARSPRSVASLWRVWHGRKESPTEVVIAGKKVSGLVRIVRETGVGQWVWVARWPPQKPHPLWAAGKGPKGSWATVCRRGTCSLPLKTPTAIAKVLLSP